MINEQTAQLLINLTATAPTYVQPNEVMLVPFNRQIAVRRPPYLDGLIQLDGLMILTGE